MSEESPLAPPTADEPAAEAPARTGPSFGNLKQNKTARGRRGQVKFFDSADWVMRGQNEGREQPQECAPAPAGPPNLSPFLPEDEAPPEGESPLADEEPHVAKTPLA